MRARVFRLAFASAWLALAAPGCGQAPQGPEAFAGAPLETHTREDGVEIQVLARGQGDAAAPGDWVLVHYRLVLPSGEVADDSHGRKPLGFFLGKDHKLIEGFHAGVEGMQVGELRRAIVPPHLGYGERSMGPIPANATLHFELELMRISK